MGSRIKDRAAKTGTRTGKYRVGDNNPPYQFVQQEVFSAPATLLLFQHPVSCGTIIVFFGDHQPNDTVASVVENGAQAETQKRYLVPYLVWSNYGIEGAKDKNTSLNYLAAQVLTAAGVPTNAYQNYLLSLSKTYPVISAAGQTKGIGADEKQLQTYKKLQYYQLFEKNKEKDE